MARLFVAAWPPPEVVEDLARQLPPVAVPGLRWIPPRNWHVTLRFLGDAGVGEAADALDRLAAGAAEAVLGPTVTRLGRSVLCVPVAGLDLLAAAVRSATAAVGQPPDPRPFTGHLTVGRRTGRRPPPALATAVRGRFGVCDVHLVHSVTRAEGAEYRIVGSWALSRPAADPSDDRL